MDDSVAWGALAMALSVVGGVITWYRWRRHGLPSLLRGTAWSLLPIAAWLTGVLELVADISGDVSRWALHLVFDPVVWLGISLAGVSVVLFGASALVRGRDDEASGDRRVRGKEKAGDRPAELPQTPRATKSGDPDGMDDIEEILRKHGIQ